VQCFQETNVKNHSYLPQRLAHNYLETLRCDDAFLGVIKCIDQHNFWHVIFIDQNFFWHVIYIERHRNRGHNLHCQHNFLGEFLQGLSKLTFSIFRFLFHLFKCSLGPVGLFLDSFCCGLGIFFNFHLFHN
jgi:hypothetical protein